MNLFLFLKIMEDPKELSYMWFVSINLNMIEIRTKKCLNYLYISSFKIITSLLNVHQKSTVLWQKNFLQDKIRKNSWICINKKKQLDSYTYLHSNYCDTLFWLQYMNKIQPHKDIQLEKKERFNSWVLYNFFRKLWRFYFDTIPQVHKFHLKNGLHYGIWKY